MSELSHQSLACLLARLRQSVTYIEWKKEGNGIGWNGGGCCAVCGSAIRHAEMTPTVLWCFFVSRACMYGDGPACGM